MERLEEHLLVFQNWMGSQYAATRAATVEHLGAKLLRGENAEGVMPSGSGLQFCNLARIAFLEAREG